MLRKNFIVISFTLLVIQSALPVFASEHEKPIVKPIVIVLHGIARSSRSMSKVAEAIGRENFEVHNMDYDSTNKSFEELVEILHGDISNIIGKGNRQVNFVGYSMGSLMIRLYIKKYRPRNLGRVVMIAPPNHGSEAADFFKENAAFRHVFGKAGQRLGTGPNGIARNIGPVNYEVGVIAGDRSVDPVSSAIIPGADDGKVSIERTRITGMKDHIIIHSSHSFIIYNREAIAQVIYYLKHGKFRRNNVSD